ncbi:MAG: prolipoprotein diacylglyceryl transferase [Sandaracinaceae bacterium]
MLEDRVWDIDPVLIQIDAINTSVTNGPLQIRYYGLFFAIGLLGAAWAFPNYFERWGFPRQHGERLTLWTPIGMIIGAHLVHLIFYEPESFFSDPDRIIQIGSGLASHGGGIGAILAVLFFARYHRQHALALMDPSMCAATFVIPWVRVGNFFNSEIVGRAWDGPWAIAFPRHYEVVDGRTVWDCGGPPGAYDVADCMYRHPSQVYEAILAFAMVGLAIYLQAKWRNRLRPGAILFILLGYYFTTRFLVEYVKEFQTLSDTFYLTMGQRLSLPIVLLSAYMLLFSKTSNIVKPIAPGELVSGPRPLPATDPAPTKKRAKPATDEPSDRDAADASASSSDDEPRARPKKRKKKKKNR